MTKIASLISHDMLMQNRELHERPEGFGGSGWRHGDAVIAFGHALRATVILDYGCGEGTLAKAIRKKARFKIIEYDPAIPARAMVPTKPCHLVACTDVLEHIEPDKLDAVLAHIYSLTAKGCYLAIATRPANKILPNGSNAHLIVEDTPFWHSKVMQFDWVLQKEVDIRKKSGAPHEVRFWLTRGK